MAANFVVGNVEEDIALALKQLAAAHGRSAEAEHHEILRNVLKRPKGVQLPRCCRACQTSVKMPTSFSGTARIWRVPD